MSAALNAGTITINLITNTAKFSKGMLGAGSSFDNLGKKALSGTAKMVKYGAVMTGVAAGGLAYLVNENLKGIDATAKFADRVNTSIEALTGLHHAAQLTGTSQSTINKGLVFLTRNLKEAESGTGPAADALKELNLDVKDLINLPADQALLRVADQMGGLDNAASKTSVSFDLFGRAGTEMLNMMKEGGPGIRDMIKDAENLGLTYSRIDAAKVEQANDALLRVKGIVGGIGQQFTISIAPYLTALADMFIDGAASGDGYKSVIQDVVKTGIEGAGWLIDKWYLFQQTWHGLTIIGAEIQRRFAVTANAGYQAVTFLGDVFSKWFTAVKLEWKLFGGVVDVIWDGLKFGFASVVQTLGNQLSNLLHQASSAARAFKDTQGLADDLTAAAGAVAAKTGGMYATASNDLKESSAEVVKTATEFKNAVLDIANAQGKSSALLMQIEQDAIRNGEVANQKYFATLDKKQEAHTKYTAAIIKAEETAQAAAVVTAEKNRVRTVAEIENTEEIIDAQDAAIRAQRGRMQGVASSLGDLMTISEQFKDSNKAAFTAYKFLAQSQAGINAWLSYSQVMADPLIQPTWLKQGMANISLAAGLTAATQIGKRANGGGVGAGGMYEVNERGPELLSMDGRNFLMMGNRNGRVSSNESLNARSGRTMPPQVHVHNYSNERAETKTSDDGQRIDVIIGRVKSAIAADIGNGSGDVPKSIESSYGLARSGRR